MSFINVGKNRILQDLTRHPRQFNLKNISAQVAGSKPGQACADSLSSSDTADTPVAATPGTLWAHRVRQGARLGYVAGCVLTLPPDLLFGTCCGPKSRPAASPPTSPFMSPLLGGSDPESEGKPSVSASFVAENGLLSGAYGLVKPSICRAAAGVGAWVGYGLATVSWCIMRAVQTVVSVAASYFQSADLARPRPAERAKMMPLSVSQQHGRCLGGKAFGEVAGVALYVTTGLTVLGVVFASAAIKGVTTGLGAVVTGAAVTPQLLATYACAPSVKRAPVPLSPEEVCRAWRRQPASSPQAPAKNGDGPCETLYLGRAAVEPEQVEEAAPAWGWEEEELASWR